jgi:N-methylhydantoinase A
VNRFHVGTDIGGTFTDMAVVDEAGGCELFKLPTTPEDRSQSVFDCFGLAAKHYGLTVRSFLERVVYFAHGTTTATNALIERTGAPTALLTTRGAGDALRIQRGTVSWASAGEESGHYSIRQWPVPLIPREAIFEVDERTDASGAEVVPLNGDQVRAAVARMRAAGIEAVAICFLWSFLRPAHEQQAAAIISAEWPAAFVSRSSEVAPVIGEYERSATTVVNAYLGPVVGRYVARLNRRLRQNGFAGEFTMLDSAGGVMSADSASSRAVELLISGPAGGLLASAALGTTLGAPDIITADMGGTSFDVGLVTGGRALVVTTAFDGGYHLAAPRVAVTACGAGGGSIASVDDSGALVVGPRSAGSVPGPACYGKGGVLPTVTDADVVLGIISPDRFLGGRMRLFPALATEAIRKHIAEPLGMTVPEAADGIRRVVDAQMADRLRAATIRQGRDPRDFVLFAYGGAGPAHAYAFAPDAGITRVVIPRTATVHSAYGALRADRFRLYQATDRQRTPAWADDPAVHLDVARINACFAALQDRCAADFGAGARADAGADGDAGVGGDAVRMDRFLHFRYRGQAGDLAVPVPGSLDLDSLRTLIADFHKRYEQVFGAGTSLPEAGLEIGVFRLEGRAFSPAASGAGWSRKPAGSLADARVDRRDAVFARPFSAGSAGSAGSADSVTGAVSADGPVTVDVYDGQLLPGGAMIAGPAIIDCPGTTVVVGPGQRAAADDDGNIVITAEDDSHDA